MKITDKGLNQVLSLGLFKKTETPGLYFLYSWKGVQYFCGLESSKQKFNTEKDIFISLSKEQFTSLPTSDHKSSSNPELIKLAEYFETALHFSYNPEDNTVRVLDFAGAHTTLQALKITLEKPSPFKIAQETNGGFHGLFSPIVPCAKTLKNSGLNIESLWISLWPLFKKEAGGKSFCGFVAGFSENKTYGLDALDLLKNYKALSKSEAA